MSKGEDMIAKGIVYEVQIFNKAGECVCRIAVATLEHGKEMLPRLKKSILWKDCTYQLVEIEAVNRLIRK